jgi:hypothetical protein
MLSLRVVIRIPAPFKSSLREKHPLPVVALSTKACLNRKYRFECNDYDVTYLLFAGI